MTAFVAITISFTAAQAQTLFTYGTKAVSKEEFLKAFNKNPDTTGSRTEKLNQYLNMYINFKLKIEAGRDEKLNLTGTYKNEAENFRDQLVNNYINEQANINTLIQEAFQRSQKDIMVSQVFVEVKQGADTTEAYKQIKQAYDALQHGRDFSEVAATFSTDESVKQVKGKIGYITVFTLPYEIENLVYQLQPGNYTNIYRSGVGYHIFKNVSERPTAGKRRIQQILFKTPETFSDTERKAAANLADSVYKRLLKGESFEKMIEVFGTTNTSDNSSNITEVNVGQYSAAFEREVFALQKPRDISKPFLTPYGYNIIKLVEIIPVSTDVNDVVNRAHIQEQVEQDKRLSIAKDALIQKWMKLTLYTPATYSHTDLIRYSDSSLKKGRAIAVYKTITPKTTLFSFAKQKVTVANWLQFIMEAKQTGASYANDAYEAIMKEFIKVACDRYYRSHIEEIYPPIAAQVNEFNEANLLFAVMDKHVWSKAAQDSTGLKNYYNEHKQQYTWQPGVTALVISATSRETIDSIAKAIKNNSKEWRSIISRYGNTVMADSSRFENGQLPLKQEIIMLKGFTSRPEQNESGTAYSLVYIFQVYPEIEPRNFDDARGMVINDYQQVLEQKWVEELKKKYLVKVNDSIVKNL